MPSLTLRTAALLTATLSGALVVGIATPAFAATTRSAGHEFPQNDGWCAGRVPQTAICGNSPGGAGARRGGGGGG